MNVLNVFNNVVIFSVFYIDVHVNMNENRQLASGFEDGVRNGKSLGMSVFTIIDNINIFIFTRTGAGFRNI